MPAMTRAAARRIVSEYKDWIDAGKPAIDENDPKDLGHPGGDYTVTELLAAMATLLISDKIGIFNDEEVS